MTLTGGSLFSGFGGLDLGMERAGVRVLWHSEVNAYACRVLARRFQDVPNLGDITKIDWSDVERPDILFGGFPCQNLSSANVRTRTGLAGPKSGLWRHYDAAVGALRPRAVVVENSGSAWRSWVPDVRADLARHGYASMPVVLYAGSFGAPHLRSRCFVVGYADGDCESARAVHEEASRMSPVARGGGHWGSPLPGTLRAHDGVSDGVERLRGLGNAVVPQVAEWVGRAVVRRIDTEGASVAGVTP